MFQQARKKRRPIMYTNLHEFGKAYQGELQQAAGVYDEGQIQGGRKSRTKGHGLLRQLGGRLYNRKREAKPVSSAPLGEPHSSWIG
jgi:hypothetical protein